MVGLAEDGSGAGIRTGGTVDAIEASNGELEEVSGAPPSAATAVGLGTRAGGVRGCDLCGRSGVVIGTITSGAAALAWTGDRMGAAAGASAASGLAYGCGRFPRRFDARFFIACEACFEDDEEGRPQA
jgi:hypothetical protein